MPVCCCRMWIQISSAILWLFLSLMSPAWAAKDFNVKGSGGNFLSINGDSGNVGLGTNTPQAGLVITNGRIGIGTWVAPNSSVIIVGGNVGVGSLWPGQALDVQGDLRLSDAISGASIPSPSATLEIPLQVTLNTSSGNTGIGTTLTGGNTARLAIRGGNVGIGTITPQGGLVITQGNAGIGTFAPRFKFEIVPATKTSPFVIDDNGNIGIGTTLTSNAAMVIMTGNVGVATWIPSTRFHVSSQNTNMNFYWSSEGVESGQGVNATNHSAAFGSGSATGLYSIASGNASAAGDYAAAFGASTSSGDMSFGGGTQGTTLSGRASTGLGGNGSLVASGNRSAVLGGTNLNSGSYAAVSIGQYNLLGGTASAVVASDPVMEIGRGASAATRTDVFAILHNGNVGINTGLPFNKLAINGMVGIGTSHSSFVRTLPSSGGMNVQGNVGIGTVDPQVALSAANGVGIGTWTTDGGQLIVNGGGNVGVSSAWPGQKLDVAGVMRVTGLEAAGFINIAVVSKTATYTASTTEQLILVDASGGAVTINLPTCNGAARGRVYYVKKTDGSGNSVTIDPPGINFIDGSFTYALTAQYQSASCICTGGNIWYKF